MVWKGTPDPSARTPHELKFHLLSGPVTEHFDCGTTEQNEFLLKHAWEQQQEQLSKTYLAFVAGIMVGYLTLTLGEIQLAKRERPEAAKFSRLPALKLAQMGVDKRFRGHRIGHELVAHAIIRAENLSGEYACRYLILDARPELRTFYESQGFVINEAAQKQRRDEATSYSRDPDSVPISMRFDLRRPGAMSLSP